MIVSFVSPFLLWFILPLTLLLWVSRKHRIALIHSVILILLVLALARPIQPQVLQETLIDSKDILIALDVSYSMRAKDIKPTRYDFAKEMIKAFLAKNPSDNIMLMAFTTNPLLLSPATTDHALINIALDSLNPDFILTKGTSLKRLFTKISTMNKTYKEMILITDGGEEKDLQSLIPLIRKSNISLHILALGSLRGTSIQSPKGTLLKDKEGDLVISRINPLLKSLARHVNGKYFEASHSPQASATTLHEALNNSHQAYQKSKKMQNHNKEYYGFPLFLALLLFLLLHTRGVKAIILILAFLGIQAEASFLDTYHLIYAYKNYVNKDFKATTKHLQAIETDSLQSRILWGHIYYKKSQYKQALNTYASIHSTQIKTKKYLYYHIGNSYAMLYKYKKAREYYAKALALKDDADTRYNLNLIALLEDKKKASLGIAHPKSQSNSSTKNTNASSQEKNKKKNKEDTSSSNSSGKGEGKSSEEKEKTSPNKRLVEDLEKESPHPLGSKVYELINKGYIREQRPW